MEEQFQETLEKVLGCYTQGPFEKEFLKAREEFFNLTGQVDDDQEDFETKMDIFHKWYFFDYNQSSIFEDYLQNPNFEKSLKDILKEHRHSLFEYCGKNFKGLDYFKDFITNEKIYLSKSAKKPALVRDDLFIGRFLKEGEHHFLLSGLCVLPKKVRTTLVKKAKKVGSLKDGDKKLEFLIQLLSLKNKWKRYSHIDPSKIFI
ncbi:MAG: hypothetical protein ACHQYQ_11330 [Bacteriovoracales bacterium]